jgi:hypothetical protein
MRYKRTIDEKFIELALQTDLVKSWQRKGALLEQEIEALKKQVDPKMQERVEHLHTIIDAHYNHLKEEKIKNAELTCELVKRGFDPNEKTTNTNIMAGRAGKPFTVN